MQTLSTVTGYEKLVTPSSKTSEWRSGWSARLTGLSLITNPFDWRVQRFKAREWSRGYAEAMDAQTVLEKGMRS